MKNPSMVHILAQNPSSDNANFHSSFFILHSSFKNNPTYTS